MDRRLSLLRRGRFTFWLFAHGGSPIDVYHLTFCRADSLLGGAWLALIVRGPLRDRVLRLAPAIFCLALMACLAIAFHTGSFSWQTNPTVPRYGFSFLMLLSVALIAWCLKPRSMASAVMRTHFLRFLGRYSYGIYVFHLLIDELLSGAPRLWLTGHLNSAVGLHLVLLTSNLLITLPLALLSFRFLESPFLRLKRFFNDQPIASPA